MNNCFTVFNILFLQALLVHDVATQTLAIEVGEKNISLVYKNLGFEDSGSALKFDAQLLYSKQNNHQDLLASIGLTAITAGSNVIRPGAGLKLIAADPLDYNLTAVAVGIELAYLSPTTPEYKFETSLYYAGESFTFSDGNGMSLLTTNMDFKMTNNSSIRFGYRRIKTEQINGITDDFDRGIYLGLLWTF